MSYPMCICEGFTRKTESTVCVCVYVHKIFVLYIYVIYVIYMYEIYDKRFIVRTWLAQL